MGNRKAEISQKWNWGAFWLTWIWGISHEVRIALWALIPGIGLLMRFYLGKKGNELAIKNVLEEDLDIYIEKQKKWANAGLIIAAVYFIICSFSVYGDIRDAWLADRAEQKVFSIIEDIPVIVSEFGSNISIAGNMGIMRDSIGANKNKTYCIVEFKSDKGRFYSTIIIERNKAVYAEIHKSLLPDGEQGEIYHFYIDGGPSSP